MQSYLSSEAYWASYSCTVPSAYRSGLVSERGMAVTATGTGATGAAAAATASPTADSDYAAICAAKLKRDGGSLNNNGYGYRYYDDPFGMGHWDYCDTNEDCACVSYMIIVPQPSQANFAFSITVCTGGHSSQSSSDPGSDSSSLPV